MRRTIQLLSIFNFLTDFSFLAPIAIIYFAHVSGSFTLGMSIFAIAMLSSAIFELPTGIFSDHIGRKKTIVWGTIAGIISATCYALASFHWLVLGAVFEGLARAFFSGNNDAYLYDVLKNEKRENEYHEFLGKVSAMFQVALAISALLGSVFASISFALVAWLNVIPAILRFLVSLLFKDIQQHSQQSTNIYIDVKQAIKLFLHNYKLRTLSLASMFDFAIGESAYQFRSAFVNTLWPLWAVGIAKVLSNVGAAISFYLSGKIIKKYREISSIIVGDIYSKVVNFFSLLFPSVASPALMSTTSLFYGINTVAENNLLQKEFTDQQRATMGSLNSLGGNLLFGIFALILGVIADHLTPVTGLLFFQILSLFPMFLYIHLFRYEKTKQRSYR